MHLAARIGKDLMRRTQDFTIIILAHKVKHLITLLTPNAWVVRGYHIVMRDTYAMLLAANFTITFRRLVLHPGRGIQSAFL